MRQAAAVKDGGGTSTGHREPLMGHGLSKITKEYNYDQVLPLGIVRDSHQQEKPLEDEIILSKG